MMVLPDVTLCCIDCAQPPLAQAGFGAALLQTDAAMVAKGIEVRPIASCPTATPIRRAC